MHDTTALLALKSRIHKRYISSPVLLYVLNIEPATDRLTVGADSQLAPANPLNWTGISTFTAPVRGHDRDSPPP
jgi:hypothetical protein